MKAFLDTNIIIDAMAGRKPFDKTAQSIMEAFAVGKIECAITASTATDIYYILRKYRPEKAKFKSDLKSLYEALEIITVEKADCIAAFDTGMADYEDSLVSICAKKWKADYIVSRNCKDFINSLVPAMCAEDFLLRL
jgi:predicted nucleic acid-binding protein